MFGIKRTAGLIFLSLLVLLAGCASPGSPQKHVDACKRIEAHKGQNSRVSTFVYCLQERAHEDSSTPPSDLAQVDFLAGAVRSVAARVTTGQISSENAKLAVERLVKELSAKQADGISYVSKDSMDFFGIAEDSLEFGAYVRPYTRAIASGSGTSSDSSPCVTFTCGPVSVRGYTRKDGTYVRPHTRSAPGSGRGRK